MSKKGKRIILMFLIVLLSLAVWNGISSFNKLKEERELNAPYEYLQNSFKCEMYRKSDDATFVINGIMSSFMFHSDLEKYRIEPLAIDPQWDYVHKAIVYYQEEDAVTVCLSIKDRIIKINDRYFLVDKATIDHVVLIWDLRIEWYLGSIRS